MQDGLALLSSKPDVSRGEYSGISLFSGILGLDLGLHAAGFSSVVCVDFDQDAAQVVRGNFPKLPYLTSDIRELAGQGLRDAGGISGDVDVLMGGPPCQPFSKSGLRKGMTDSRGDLLYHYVRLLEELRPRAFVFENVRGLYSSRNGADFAELLRMLQDTGYVVYWSILDSADYGVPQFRQRLFIVGFREQLRFSFPRRTHSEPGSFPLLSDTEPYVPLSDALAGLDVGYEGPTLSGKYAHLLEEIPEGLNYSFYCSERGHPNPIFEWRSKFWYFLLKADRRRPSLTIQAQPGSNTGPFHWDNRRFGIRELQRIQTIPDWFVIDCAYYTAHRLIGNAVPPLLGWHLGREIRATLENQLLLSEHELERLKAGPRGGSCPSGRRSGRGKLRAHGGRATTT